MRPGRAGGGALLAIAREDEALALDPGPTPARARPAVALTPARTARTRFTNDTKEEA
jgi:hypothetical protein